MIRDFIKKRWFTIALLLVVLIAIARKNLRVETADSPAQQEQQEIYTDKQSVPQGAALLNLGGDVSATRVSLPEINEERAIPFLKRFGRVAVAEQQKFGIPASALLACAYVNSFAGQRDCTGEANNYMALRCSQNWNGPQISYPSGCYRKYSSAWESIRDFNFYLLQCDWYPALKKSAGTDWRKWIKGFAENHVSDVENAEVEMIAVVEAYRLFELD